MLRSSLVLGAVLASSVAMAESVQIGAGRFDIINMIDVSEGRMITKAVELRWVSKSGSSRAEVVLQCSLKKGTFINSSGRPEEVQINSAERDSSITNNLWFKYCPGSKGMSKKEMKVYSKYD